MYALSHEQGGLRCWICPESTHAMWNDCRNAIRRSSLQHCLLLGSTMQNLSHGPFKSGRNQQSIQEAAAHLANTIRQDDFEELQELMALDLGVDVDDERVPQYPQDINNLPCIKNLPVFAPWLWIQFPCHVFFLISSHKLIWNPSSGIRAFSKINHVDISNQSQWCLTVRFFTLHLQLDFEWIIWNWNNTKSTQKTALGNLFFNTQDWNCQICVANSIGLWDWVGRKWWDKMTMAMASNTSQE